MLKLNGYPVIAWGSIPDAEGFKHGRCIVIVDREREFQRYVVALHVQGEEGWHNGHYISNLHLARDKFFDLWRSK